MSHVTIHPTARAFAHVAATYERGRPDYPQELREWMHGRGLLAEGTCVVDLGAGTGKLSRMLVGHGARVIAVEPLEEMRAELATMVPQAEVLAGSAEAIPLPDAVADLVTCGQSFHWFANERAIAEIARVLTPGGTLVLVWNTPATDDPLQQRLAELLDPTRGDTPTHHSGAWREPMAAARTFVADGELATSFRQMVNRAGLLDRVESTSFLAALAGAERAELLARVASLVPEGEHVALAYDTEAYAYRRIDGMMDW